MAIRSEAGSHNPKYAIYGTDASSSALVRIKEPRKVPKPEWHAPWKLMRVISGHLGWVRSVAVDISNEWFVTGAGDRVIKVRLGNPVHRDCQRSNLNYPLAI